MNAWSWIAVTITPATILVFTIWVIWRETGGFHGHSHCTCTHPRQAHLHYRRGRDCGLCPCRKYKPIDWDGWIRTLVDG
jgi:hypothetical protein